MYPPILRVHLKKKRSVKDLHVSNDSYAMFLYVCFFLLLLLFFFYIIINSDFLYKAYVVGTHLNCIDKSMQFKWVPTTYAFIKK